MRTRVIYLLVLIVLILGYVSIHTPSYTGSALYSGTQSISSRGSGYTGDRNYELTFRILLPQVTSRSSLGEISPLTALGRLDYARFDVDEDGVVGPEDTRLVGQVSQIANQHSNGACDRRVYRNLQNYRNKGNNFDPKTICHNADIDGDGIVTSRDYELSRLTSKDRGFFEGDEIIATKAMNKHNCAEPGRQICMFPDKATIHSNAQLYLAECKALFPQLSFVALYAYELERCPEGFTCQSTNYKKDGVLERGAACKPNVYNEHRWLE